MSEQMPLSQQSALDEQWQQKLPDSGSTTAATGLTWMANWGVLLFKGSDAPNFLQGYFTCDTELLTTSRLQPTAICNLQGRVVANGWAWLVAPETSATGSDIGFLVHASVVATVQEFLAKYLVFAKTKLHQASQDLRILAYLGPAPATDSSALSDATSTLWLPLCQGVSLCVLEPDTAAELWAVEPNHLRPEAVTEQLIARQIGLVSAPISQKFLPQMLGLHHQNAVDFDKGCYLGQEIVARAQHRGTIKRTLQTLSWSAQGATQVANPNAGLEIQNATGKTIGQIINACAATGSQRGMALAVVNGLLPEVSQDSQGSYQFEPAPNPD